MADEKKPDEKKEPHRNPVAAQMAANREASKVIARTEPVRDDMVRVRALKGTLAGGTFRNAGDVFTLQTKAAERAEKLLEVEKVKA